ncbi:SCO7613 C-terminal domain-containing membrane protein [Streptomyces sp. NPDC060184]|uniref:SCO7613 C-terminal domain-containing membrane protein n=1 Tax=Streptomyces sp. NPDC060184 TaxID=3347064 RepID=UPI003661E20D
MEHVPPPAEELALLDRELAHLDARRAQLLLRRAWLVEAVRASAGSARTHTAFASPTPAWGAPVPARTPSGRGAQNVLLALGGLLLAVAAIAFTLFSWGSMGIGGRSAVLATVTAAALVAPVPLRRRGLRATAEALGAFGLVLTLLDAYALHAVALPGTGGAAFAAAASAALAALWAGYGLTPGRPVLPVPAAVVAGQLPLVLGCVAVGAPALAFGWALLVTAVLDGVLAVRAVRSGVRITAAVCLAVTGSGALLLALVRSLMAGGPVAAIAPGALLVLAGAAALLAVGRVPAGLATACGLVGTLAGVAGTGGVVRAALPSEWAVVAYLLAGIAFLAVARLSAARPPVDRVLSAGAAGRGVDAAVAAVVAGTLLWTVPWVAAVLVGPLSGGTRVWAGAPEGLRDVLGGPVPPSWTMAAPVALAVVAALGATAHRWVARPAGAKDAEVLAAARTPAFWTWWRSAAPVAVPAQAACAVLVAAAVADVPYAAGAVLETLLVAGALELLVRLSRGPARSAAGSAALGCALAGTVSVAALSLHSQAATYAVVAALTVLFAAAALRLPELPARSVAACTAVLGGIALTAAAVGSLGLSASRGAPLLLVVPAVTVALGRVLRRRPVAVPVELTGAFGALVAVGLAVTDPAPLALVLGLSGVLAAGTAVRPERRKVAGAVALVLFVLASWVRLAASEVTAPEAYTLPVTLPALAVGVLRRRAAPGHEVSSWTAYGVGLAVTLVPSLLAAWGDPGWTRPLLLGLAALAVTLAGARSRLQAPLLLGGGVLALLGLHELAPYVVQVVGALPRWLVPAAAGVLLLAVGATYEKRLRDARRVKEALGRMR